MEEAPVTAATGSLGPVIAKLNALQSTEYKLRRRTQRDVNVIKSKLMLMHSLLWNIWERGDLDEASKALKMEALDLADDMADAIEDFVLCLERSRSSRHLIQTKMKSSPFKDLKKRVDEVSRRCRLKWKKKTSLISTLFSRRQDTAAGKPRAHPFVRKDASQLVCLDRPRDELIQHLVGEDEISTPMQKQIKMASIVGMAGMGKTTLADLVYQSIGDKFESRAFVTLTPGGNMREVFASILEQVAATSRVPVAETPGATEVEHLIDIISNFLKDKRYLVIVDDIWHCGEWEFIKKSFPENNMGSRIVTTTRNYSMATKWDEDVDTLLYHMEFLNGDAAEGMRPDMVGEDFDSSHPVVYTCGGVALALVCMFSALAKARERQEQQGLSVNTPDLQNSIEEKLKRDGIQNIPGFEPLAESLQIGYDQLPHHMLKTCLLYCSIYPIGSTIIKDDLVWRLIAQGFVHEEEAATGYFDELVNMGFILCTEGSYWMHPMMRAFLRWRSREDNFITCSSEIPYSYTTTSRIRRLCIDSDLTDPLSGLVDSGVSVPLSGLDDSGLKEPLSGLQCSRIRSLVFVDGNAKTVPLEKFDHLQVLDLGGTSDDHHLKVMCGLVCVGLRHLLGLHGLRISEIPPEIRRLRHLETLEVGGTNMRELPSEIGDLQQLKTLVVSFNSRLEELPSEIGNLRQLKTLVVSWNSRLEELPSEIGNLHELRTLVVSWNDVLEELPSEIGNLHQLRTLDMSYSAISKLPGEIGNLHQLKSLDMSHSVINELPSEIGELRNLEQLMLSSTRLEEVPKDIGKMKELKQLMVIRTPLAKIPKEIGKLKELKILGLDDCTNILTLPSELAQLAKSEKLPDCVGKTWNRSDVMSSLASEMLSFRIGSNQKGGLVVGAKQMHVPQWIKEHFNDLDFLDIRICKLEQRDLKILCEMPHLQALTLRFEVVPRKPIAISSEGFTRLEELIIDSRAPRVTFQEGAMPMLRSVAFEFQFYGGPPNKDPIGINHLPRLQEVDFRCHDWYGAGNPCISATIDVARKEAQQLVQTRVNSLNKIIIFRVSGREVEVLSDYGTGEMDECSSNGQNKAFLVKMDECSSIGTCCEIDECSS